MPRPRKLLVDLNATPYYHCMSRCVRRYFLLGEDRLTGKNFDHRKQWIAERIEALSQIFAAGVCSYGLMSNHFHLVLRMEPEAARLWTPGEVSMRYAKLFRPTVERSQNFSALLQAQLNDTWRQRLSDLSWYMRCLNEWIARRVNEEDGCDGRFWQGRFRSQALFGTEALMTCMAYVDLNPIRAGINGRIEKADYTSIQQRLLAAAAQRRTWLLPFQDQVVAAEGREPLAMRFEDYERLLRWAADGIVAARADASGSGGDGVGGDVGDDDGEARTPADEGGRWRAEADRGEAAAAEATAAAGGESNPAAGDEVAAPPVLLHRHGVDALEFVASLRGYMRGFFTMIGTVDKLTAEAERRGYKRRPGIGAARRLFRGSG